MSSADFTLYTPGTGTLSYMVSTPLGKNSALILQLMSFTFTIFTIFSFQQVPITAGWAEAVWNEKFAQHFYT